MENLPEHPVKAVIVGCGHRSMIYASYAKLHPDELTIVGAADPSEKARRAAAETFGLPNERLFDSAQALAAVPRFADAVINGTMDEEHVRSSIPLLRRGYVILLEKPFAVNEAEMDRLLRCVEETDGRVMVCHVLRYAHFYEKIKELLLAGTLGRIITLSTDEFVAYDHMATSYVRGKWAREEACKSSILLSKCSHDLDILTWLMSGDAPISVSSFGSRSLFRPESAPKNAGTRCLADCPLVDDCRYSAKRIYLERPGAWDGYVWNAFGCVCPPPEEAVRSLKTDNPYGRCVYRCDNDVYDRQTVSIRFQSGAIATHRMVGGAACGGRSIHITGEKGEIYGRFEKNRLHVRLCAPAPDKLYEEHIYDFSNRDLEGHGGGDMRLMQDFIRFATGQPTSFSCTGIRDSVAGHLTVFRADRSAKENGQPRSLCP